MDDNPTPEERELGDVFAGIHAPGSMRRYGSAGKPPSGPMSRHRGQALAAVLVVALVGAAAGTYFGLRDRGGRPGTGGGPAARAMAAMAFDPDRGEMVMFGGAANPAAAFGDTWLWDGSAWTQAHPQHSPPARYGSAMAWDPRSHRVILVGGTEVPVKCDYRACDVWAWDGRDWSELQNQPADLSGYVSDDLVMATDGQGGRIVMVTHAYPQVRSSGSASASGSATSSSGGSSGSSGGSGSSTGVVVPPACPPSAACWIKCPAGAPCPTMPAYSCLQPAVAVPPGATNPVPPCPLPPYACPQAGAAGTVNQPGTSSQLCLPPCFLHPTPSGVPPASCPGCPTAGSLGGGVEPCAPTPLPGPATITWTFDGSIFHRVPAGRDEPATPRGGLVWVPSFGHLVHFSLQYQMVPMEAAGTPTFACRLNSPCPASSLGGASEWQGDRWAALKVPVSRSTFFELPTATDVKHSQIVALDPGGRTWILTTFQQDWTEVHAAPSIPGRSLEAMAYDSQRGEVVVFGGSTVGLNSRPGSDTWTWDGTRWTLRGGTAPALLPSPPPIHCVGTITSSGIAAPAQGNAGSPIVVQPAPAAGANTVTGLPQLSPPPAPTRKASPPNQPGGSTDCGAPIIQPYPATGAPPMRVPPASTTSKP